jgi:hypothetical protein
MALEGNYVISVHFCFEDGIWEVVVTALSKSFDKDEKEAEIIDASEIPWG